MKRPHQVIRYCYCSNACWTIRREGKRERGERPGKGTHTHTQTHTHTYTHTHTHYARTYTHTLTPLRSTHTHTACTHILSTLPSHPRTTQLQQGRRKKQKPRHPKTTRSQCLRQLASSKMKPANGDGSRGSLACSETAQVTNPADVPHSTSKRLGPSRRQARGRAKARGAIGRAGTISLQRTAPFPSSSRALALCSFPSRPLAPPPDV
jgi:hypothetical protein